MNEREFVQEIVDEVMDWAMSYGMPYTYDTEDGKVCEVLIAGTNVEITLTAKEIL